VSRKKVTVLHLSKGAETRIPAFPPFQFGKHKLVKNNASILYFSGLCVIYWAKTVRFQTKFSTVSLHWKKHENLTFI